MATPVSHSFTKAELREIERHKYFLSQRAGYDVGFECAAADWERRFGRAYRENRPDYVLSLQREEIARHVWIESEKAGRDLGRAAQLDWVQKYAAKWRDWYNREYGPQS